jgi:hypothetical protein
MTKFRGQYMDMVHPSSDVHVADKLNHAYERPVKEQEPPVSPQPEEEIATDVLDEIIVEDEAAEAPETEAYESPFLPNVEVEKRPLGGDSSAEDADKQPSGIDNDAHDIFDIDDFIDLSQPELPADDGGKGELEPELPSGDETEMAIAEPESKPEPARTTVVNTMITPQYKVTEVTQPSEPSSPFAHASVESTTAVPKRLFPIWGWILVFILLAIVGAAVGALIYLSGWLG